MGVGSFNSSKEYFFIKFYTDTNHGLHVKIIFSEKFDKVTKLMIAWKITTN